MGLPLLVHIGIINQTSRVQYNLVEFTKSTIVEIELTVDFYQTNLSQLYQNLICQFTHQLSICDCTNDCQLSSDC